MTRPMFEGPGLRLCAGDGLDPEPMEGCAILVENDDLGSAPALCDALPVGGRITVPSAFRASQQRFIPLSSGAGRFIGQERRISMRRLGVAMALAVGIAGCETVHVETEASRPQLAARLGVAPEQIVFARHVNYALIPYYAQRSVTRGRISGDFQSAIFVLTKSAVVLLSTSAATSAPMLTLPLSDISGVAVQHTTTTLTREHVQQLQIEVRSALLALTCADSSDQVGGTPADTQVTYAHLLSARLPTGEPHEWVAQESHVNVPALTIITN